MGPDQIQEGLVSLAELFSSLIFVYLSILKADGLMSQSNAPTVDRRTFIYSWQVTRTRTVATTHIPDAKHVSDKRLAARSRLAG